MLQSWGEQVRLAQHFRKPTSTCHDAPINSSVKTCLSFESQGRTSRRNTGISLLLITDDEIIRLGWILLSHDKPWSLPIAHGTTRALPEEMCIIIQDWIWYTQPRIAKEQGPRLNIKTDLGKIVGHFLSYPVYLFSMFFWRSCTDCSEFQEIWLGSSPPLSMRQ